MPQRRWSWTSRRTEGALAVVFVVVLVVVVVRPVASDSSRVPCYDRSGRAQRCFAPFVNAAFNLAVESTNTCGMRGEEYFCQQTGISGATKSCDVCDNGRRDKAHPPQYLTDFHSVESLSWWQSSTMMEDVQWPNSVNLTLHLGKAFEITYVRLKFHSSRPESFAIYKRTSENGSWIPYQFYSASCQETYRLHASGIIDISNEAQAICRDDFSDISPLTGGSIAFSTLDGRPSAYDFENSPVLQEWVTATDIRIVLNRINTFRDEVFGDPNVLRSYFYAISDFAVGGRCKCNGHASECTRQTNDHHREERLVCRCEHNTTGPDCGECHPFYNDRPWRRATAANAYECMPCNCNGLSNRCYFDAELFRRTGHGGHCTDCRENTFGPNCERCKEFFYRRTDSDRCRPCNCHPVGARQLQCDASGQCHCKPGVTGDKCDRCQANYFDFGITGCRPCQCLAAGSSNNRPDCISETGDCRCKENVEGQNCDTCKRGFFGLSENDPQGCMACFCYGHSSICSSSPGYTARVVHSDFESGLQRWRGESRGMQETQLEFNARAGHIGISSDSSDASYFVAPDRYHGDQRHSYNLFLSFSLWVGEEGSRPSVTDIVIEGGGLRISAPISAQGNPAPKTVKAEYKFRLNEHPSYQWTPRLSAIEFIRILSNITSLKIRGTYGNRGVGFLDNVRLQSAREGNGGTPASNIEQCTCPEGYVGQFCESCAPGYRRDPVGGGPFDRCVPCNCNRHSETCEPTTGRCICQHNTAGLNCERCAPGYYGYALAGTPHDCKPCPCPENSECVELMNGEVGCVNCREGYTGHRCELCDDGYFGDHEGRHGPRRPCVKCTCNDNIDSNAVGNCNRTTGECLKCIHNTAGFHCERCLPSHYGDALAQPKGQCRACNCYGLGSIRSPHGSDCDHSGRCRCQSNVIGVNCDRCLESYWNIDSGSGCESCNCDRTGSINSSCELRTGQCFCKPGVAGQHCGRCADGHFGFSHDGCRACNCNPDGSRTLQCNRATGECECKPNIGGHSCDRCAENKYNIAAGCLDCPVCYNMIQQNVNILRRKINELRLIIQNIHQNPGVVDDTDFKRKLYEMNNLVIRLWQDAKKYTGGNSSLADQMDIFRMAVTDLTDTLTTVTTNINTASHSSQKGVVNTTAAERLVDDAEKALREAERHLEIEGQDALREAKEAQVKLGHQSDRMTRIASEARSEAERQEEHAEQIGKTAGDALSTSEDALRTAQEALTKPSDVARDIIKIKGDISSTGVLFNETKKFADDSLKMAKDVYRDSLEIYTEVESVRTVAVDVTSSTAEINRIKEEAGQIKQEADDLIIQHQSLLADTDRQRQRGEEYLENGIKEQQITDELLADADAARDMARKAVAKAEGILLEAKETLRTLQEFDHTVRDNRLKAEEALKKIDIIRGFINDAEQKTAEARANLADAETDARLASQIAMMAKSTSENTWHQITLIKNETEITRRRVVEVTEESNRLSADLDDLERRLQDLERQAEEDATLAKQALEKADNARTAATTASNSVSGALATVDDILRQLANLDEIDHRKLGELEESLNDAERRLAAENIELRYKELEDLDKDMKFWLYDYDSQLSQLSHDVANIRDINATIPRTCFKRIILEPTEKPNFY